MALLVAPVRYTIDARAALERWLEAERDRLPLWIPVMLGAGVTAWFALPRVVEWEAVMLAALAFAAAALAVGRGGRAGVALAVAGTCVAAGVGLAWWRAERVAQPVLARPAIVRLRARIERVEPLPARALVRLRVTPLQVLPNPDAEPWRRASPALPPTIRINLADADVPAGITRGQVIELGARLLPPQHAGVPGAYDYSHLAWFDGVGASGRGFKPIHVLSAPLHAPEGVRAPLTRHIEMQLPGSVGGVAAAFVTGDVAAISLADQDAMRRSGLAHLLSVSGLHISAAVAATMLVFVRLFALSPALALRFRLPMLAAGAGAVAAIGYTLLSGAEVPTIRSCVAALFVLAARLVGREAVTLRLVAAGAFVVLVLWPESLAGPSFQLSFAAVTSIIALHEQPWVRARLLKRDEPRWRSLTRELVSLLGTGFLVEFALMPIAVYFFHKAGIYGAFANIIGIPLSTFVIMPAEALGLVLDSVGLGTPGWWVAGKAIEALLWIARTTAVQPGAVTVLPTMPEAAFALMVVGGLWIALWHTRWRRLGAVPLAIGAVWALLTQPPDLLVTGDGRHVAIRTDGGRMALLRDRASDYTRDMLTVNGGVDGDARLLAEQPTARCNDDICLATRTTGGHTWRILATRSSYRLPWAALTKLCGDVDIVISDRRLPSACHPRWLELTPKTLKQTGGLAITLATARIVTVLTPGDEHPWARAVNRNDEAAPPTYPGYALGSGHSVARYTRD